MVFHVALGQLHFASVPSIQPTFNLSTNSIDFSIWLSSIWRRLLRLFFKFFTAGAVVIISVVVLLVVVNDLTILDFTAFSFYIHFEQNATTKNIRVQEKKQKSRRARKILLTSSFFPSSSSPLSSPSQKLLYWNELVIILCIFSIVYTWLEFAVNCFQLRIKFYNLHVPIHIYFMASSFRSHKDSQKQRQSMPNIKWKPITKYSRKIWKTFIIWLVKLVNMLMVDWGPYILRAYDLNILRRHLDICFSVLILINWAINLIGLCWKHHKVRWKQTAK